MQRAINGSGIYRENAVSQLVAENCIYANSLLGKRIELDHTSMSVNFQTK